MVEMCLGVMFLEVKVEEGGGGVGMVVGCCGRMG